MFGKGNKFKFDLGDKTKDKITGFVGLVVCRTQWLNQCNTYGIRSQTLKDGAPIEPQYFDEPQMELVKGKVMPKNQHTGGPNGPVPQTNRL